MTFAIAILAAVALAAIAVEPRRRPTLAPYVLICPHCDGCLARHSEWCTRGLGVIRQLDDARRVP